MGFSPFSQSLNANTAMHRVTVRAVEVDECNAEVPTVGTFDGSIWNSRPIEMALQSTVIFDAFPTTPYYGLCSKLRVEVVQPVVVGVPRLQGDLRSLLSRRTADNLRRQVNSFCFGGDLFGKTDTHINYTDFLEALCDAYRNFDRLLKQRRQTTVTEQFCIGGLERDDRQQFCGFYLLVKGHAKVRSFAVLFFAEEDHVPQVLLTSDSASFRNYISDALTELQVVCEWISGACLMRGDWPSSNAATVNPVLAILDALINLPQGGPDVVNFDAGSCSIMAPFSFSHARAEGVSIHQHASSTSEHEARIHWSVEPQFGSALLPHVLSALVASLSFDYSLNDFTVFVFPCSDFARSTVATIEEIGAIMKPLSNVAHERGVTAGQSVIGALSRLSWDGWRKWATSIDVDDDCECEFTPVVIKGHRNELGQPRYHIQLKLEKKI